MKYTILFVFIALLMSIAFIACSSNKKNTTDDAAKRTKSLVVDTQLLQNKWKLVRTKDSYNDVWNTITQDNKIISFSTDKKYTEQKPGNHLCEGTYSIENNILTVKHSCNQVALKYTILAVSKKELQLSQQGRHGAVISVFQKQK